MSKLRMVAELAQLAVPAVNLTSLEQIPLSKSAALMVDAYQGTVDWSEGDDELVAEHELKQAISGGYGQYLASASLAKVDERGEPLAEIACALIASIPTILFVFTAKSHKRRGHAEALIRAAAFELQRTGYKQVALYVTDSNPALRIYQRLGFELDETEDSE